jgi:hypothetical protein
MLPLARALSVHFEGIPRVPCHYLAFDRPLANRAFHRSTMAQLFLFIATTSYRNFSWILQIIKKAHYSFKVNQNTHVSELNDAHLSKVRQTVMRGIFVHNQRNVLHRLGTKPTSHDEGMFVIVN